MNWVEANRQFWQGSVCLGSLSFTKILPFRIFSTKCLVCSLFPLFLAGSLFFFSLSFALWNSGKFLSDFQTFLIWLASPKVFSLFHQYHACLLSCFSLIWLFATLWTIACQAPLSMGFSRQEYWSALHFLLQWIFLTLGSNPGLLHCRQILYRLRHQGSPLYYF